MDVNSAEIESGGAPTWAQIERRRDDEAWRDVDRALRTIARRRAGLDAEEARWLREAERVQVWRPLGMAHMTDYLERVMGYAPKTAQERLRVARALGALPMLSEELATGGLSFSAVRELTRVATGANEAAWRDAARGKNLRQVEELVADRALGSLPDDPPEPTARRHVVRFEVSAATFALLRQARLALDEEHGGRLEDDELVAALCSAALERMSEATSTVETDAGTEAETVKADATGGRAKYQIALVVCPRCDQGCQEGAGVRVPIDAATLDRARCDAQHIGSLDGDVPERAHQDIPPSMVRFVWRRDGGRCQTPGCRSALGLELHHVIRRADGGSHESGNLTLRCSACHMAIHSGTLIVTGTAPDRLVCRRRNEESAHVEAAKLDAAVARAEVRDALVRMGWKAGIARSAVDAARGRVGTSASFEALIREALRCCPKPGMPG